MNNADDLRDAQPWKPITEPLDLAILGKLLEELGELTSAISRCIIQGIDEKEPVSGKVNREWLAEEIADVYASLALTIGHVALDPRVVATRSTNKIKHLRQWHDHIAGPG